ncbi:histidine phosphatase family protein [Mycobacterium sp.]|uniref:histidine phosphatase family protein n=1 Tax=Mycobacterium sp. TaxID=1785 RepID=UPI003D6B75D8
MMAGRFGYGAFALLTPVLLGMGTATAWAEESIISDFVRHAQSVANQNGIIDTVPPGTPLSLLGDQQADTVAGIFAQDGPYAGIYLSDELRAIETAQYLTGMHGMPALQTLPGLDEINAVDTIFGNTVGGGGGNPTDVVFSSERAMATWTLMNVKNLDFPFVLAELLKAGQLVPNEGQVVVSGDPQDGWTLGSFDIWEALIGNPATIIDAIGAGISYVGTATLRSPAAVIDDIVNALGGDLGSGFNPGDLSPDLAGALPGELGTTIASALMLF